MDETFIGRGKYNRGRRQGQRGWWFATLTEQGGRKTGLTHWKLVRRRDLETLHSFILPHLASAMTVVVSDYWKGYVNLGEYCRHCAVNHSKEFVTYQGYHTNHAEGVRGTIKGWVKRQHYNYEATPLQLQRNVALQCVKLGATHMGLHQAWQCRMQNLLNCVLLHYGAENPEREEVSESSCSDSDVSGDSGDGL